jgi:uncharacterized damage-inducible protein DinB
MATDYSNPSPDASEHPEEYVAKLLQLLGECDPVEVQSQLVERIRGLVDGLSDEQLRAREAPGKWSVLEVVQHLADTEVVYRYRMRMSVAQPGSPIPDYDQDRWASGLRYNEAALENVLHELDAFRSANLAWIGGLSDEELDRAGIHEERGLESVGRIVELLAAHDLVHCRQIERIKAAVM